MQTDTKVLIGALAVVATIFISTTYLESIKTTLGLVTDKSTYQLGEDIPVSVVVVTQTFPSKIETSGVDAFVEYDPTFLELQATGSATSSNAVTRFLKDSPSVFSQFAGAAFLQKGTSTVFAFSALISGGGEKFSGVGTVGVLHFKAKKEGQTTIKIEHDRSTVAVEDATVGAKDELDEVYDLTINIGSGSGK